MYAKRRMNAQRRLMLVVLGMSIFTQASAPAGGKYCQEYPEGANCQTPTVTLRAVKTQEPPSEESTATDAVSDTPAPADTPVPTATATPTPIQTENPSPSCEVNLVQALDNGWVEITISYRDGADESTWWYFTANGASHPWTDEWFGISGQTRVYGDLFNPGESFTVDVFVNGNEHVCSRGIYVPIPTPTEPTPTQEPTQPPQEASCTFSVSSNDEGWVEASITYELGPQGPGIWWVAYYQRVGEESWTEWAGWDVWEGQTHTMGMIFAPGEYNFRVDVLDYQRGACRGQVIVPDSQGTSTNDSVEESVQAPTKEPEPELPDVKVWKLFGTTAEGEAFAAVYSNGVPFSVLDHNSWTFTPATEVKNGVFAIEPGDTTGHSWSIWYGIHEGQFQEGQQYQRVWQVVGIDHIETVFFIGAPPLPFN